jgi:hypothetical protein
MNGEKRNAYRLLMSKPQERDHWEDQDVCGWIILRRDRRVVWTGMMWLRIETSGRLLCKRYSTVEFHEILESS